LHVHAEIGPLPRPHLPIDGEKQADRRTEKGEVLRKLIETRGFVLSRNLDDAPAVHRQLAGRGSIRQFRDEPVPHATLRRLCALARWAPTKSDLQQRDIIIIESPTLRSQIAAGLTKGRLGQK
jgi:hypothetical protein